MNLNILLLHVRYYRLLSKDVETFGEIVSFQCFWHTKCIGISKEAQGMRGPQFLHFHAVFRANLAK